MAPGGKAFIIFNFPPGVSLFVAEDVGDLWCPGRRPCMVPGVFRVLTDVAVCHAGEATHHRANHS